MVLGYGSLIGFGRGYCIAATQSSGRWHFLLRRLGAQQKARNKTLLFCAAPELDSFKFPLLPKAPEYVPACSNVPPTPRAVIRESPLLAALPAIPRQSPVGHWSGIGARGAFAPRECERGLLAKL
jgi:hypothetical protein